MPQRNKETERRWLLYAPGICRSSILFLGPRYNSVSSSLQLISQWLALYFHPTWREKRKGEMPPTLAEGIHQARNNLHKLISIDSPQSYAELGQYAYVSFREKELGGFSEEELEFAFRKPDTALLNSSSMSTTSSPQASARPGSSKRPRWFISDRGQIGLAPSASEEGDLICQFKDCDVVALVRKTGWSKSCSLVGRGVLMPRWDEDLPGSGKKFRYSICDDAWFGGGFRQDVSRGIERNRVLLYVDAPALWALTR